MVAMVPERRAEIVALGTKTIVSGTLSTLMTAAVVGLLTPPRRIRNFRFRPGMKKRRQLESRAVLQRLPKPLRPWSGRGAASVGADDTLHPIGEGSVRSFHQFVLKFFALRGIARTPSPGHHLVGFAGLLFSRHRENLLPLLHSREIRYPWALLVLD